MQILNNSLVLTILIQSIIILFALFLVYYFYSLNRISKSKTHLQASFDSINDPMAVINEDFTISRTNKAYSVLTNYKFSELIGKKCYKVLRGLQEPCVDCKLKETIDTNEKSFIQLTDFPKLEGGKSISITFYPQLSIAKPAVLEHIRDITELEVLREKLEERNSALSRTNTNLTLVQKEIDNELELARQVQQNLLPQYTTQFSALSISHIYHPIQSVGGDLYDFIQIDEENLGLFIGDVSGHGLSAAFVGTIAKMSLYQHSKTEMSTDSLLSNINIDLLNNVKTVHYLTCFWSIFNKNSNKLTYSRAGHPMPIVLTAKGDIYQLNASGTFLGMLEDTFVEEKNIFLEKGDKVFLFTDGIYEVTNKLEVEEYTELIGYNGFLEIIKEIENLDLDNIIPEIRKKLSAYKYEDDYTLIAFEVNSLPTQKPTFGFSYHQIISQKDLSKLKDINNIIAIINREMKKYKYGKDKITTVCEQLSSYFNTVNKIKSVHSKSIAFSISEEISTFSIITDISSIFDELSNVNLNESKSSISFSLANNETV